MNVDADMLERLREVVPMGGAVCLVGAGFSIAATNQSGKSVPSTHALIEEIKTEVGIDTTEDASLADIADFCEDHPQRQEVLRRILIDRLTLCVPSKAQKDMVNQPWRSIFTTNFDDTLERCLPDGSHQTITPTSESTKRIAGRKPLYYMHGRAKDLLESDKDPRFVISERNYIDLDSTNENLYNQLKNELFCAKFIVIVGYSMRDLDIARILFGDGQAFRKKTLIICSPDEKSLSISRLKKFGHVLPIGLTGLAEALNLTDPSEATTPKTFQFVEDIQITEDHTEFEGDDFVKLILTGDFSREKYQSQTKNDKNSAELYCIRRSKSLEIIINRKDYTINRFIACSDIGNGKSVFMEQLTVELILSGYRVLRISSSLSEVFEEIETALSTSIQTAFLIDDVIRYRHVARFIGSRINANCLLVCSTRADANDHQLKEVSNELGGAVRQIDLDNLSHEELQSWDRALERWGLWEQRISLSTSERLKFLSHDCGAENRSIVLSLFRNPQIAKRIDQIVSFFLRTGNHSRAFAAILTSSLCQQHVTWESLVSWLELDEQRLREDIRRSEISNLFSNGRNWNALTSSQLAEYILRKKYVTTDKDTLVDVFSLIVTRTAESATDKDLGSAFRENLKELVKFRFLTRLFGDDSDALRLINLVYKRLSRANLIRKNPQFWLQYAMSKMEIGDLENAETYINTALGLAKDKGKDYSPYQIIDQRARLYFMKNSIKTGSFNVDEINTAIKDLLDGISHKDREIVYTFRAVPIIYKFIECQTDDLSRELREEILSLLEKINAAGDGYTNLPRSQKGETKALQRAIQDALMILR